MDLPPGQHIPRVRLNLAQRILSKATEGEGDPVRLCADALKHVVSPIELQRQAIQFESLEL